MRTLMHMCCAPCANRPIDNLRQDGIDVTGYWFNPNIHPYTEYRDRKTCLEAYAKEIHMPLVVVNDYGLREFVRNVADNIDGRCVYCYSCRMEETAKYAAEHGFDSFTTSLLISPYQQHDAIRKIAENMGEKYGVEFLYRDFRPLFRDGQDFAREHGFYMQKYCGCVFSEEDRYLARKRRRAAERAEREAAEAKAREEAEAERIRLKLEKEAAREKAREEAYFRKLAEENRQEGV